MKKRLILKVLMVIMVLSTISCMTDEDIEESLAGEWIEVTPVSDRTTLIFSSGNKLSRIDEEGNSEVYNYRIEDNSLFLSFEGEEGSTELYFNKTEPGRFKIGNLYPSIPEREEVIMIFEMI